jgi:hypothetical protein
LGTHDTGRKQTNKYTLEKTEGAIKNEQSRDLCRVYPMLPVSLGCSFLITPSVFSNVYLFVCFRPVSCVPNVASVSGLKTEGVIKNEESRDTDNIGYTRHRTKTNKQINVREN